MPRLSSFFCDTIAVDLGTVNTLAFVEGKGIVYREPTVLAVSGRERAPLAVGEEALSLVWRAPGSVNVEYPLRDGVVADHILAEAMLRHVFLKSLGRRLPGTGLRAVLCVPASVTEVEQHALITAAKNAGAKDVYLMEEPFAAALGADLPVSEETGCMVADIGGGTADCAVLALGGTVCKRSMRCAGTHFTLAIAEYLQVRYGLIVSPAAAETLKLALGSALPGKTGGMEVTGQDLASGLPCSRRVYAAEVYEALQPPLKQIYSLIRKTLESTPPELAGDLVQQGILLTGGGANLCGLAESIARRMRLQVHIAEDPELSVIRGLHRAAEDFRAFFGQKRDRNAG
ncbi:MAG: rod shape-determining protein [Clostridia bacterium]|nr:rod shape-determining protein [Clostridia bacterium]